MEETSKRLPLKQERFCQLYASDREFFGNGVQSYAEAYGIDLARKQGYATCRVNSSKLLTNTAILARIDELLEAGGLNDVFVDKRLRFWVTQLADPTTSLAAIREYNKLKQRIVDRTDVTSGGEKLTINVLNFNADADDTV